MTTMAVCSLKGAPGTTIAALAFTAALAAHGERPAVLIEADTAGGDLAPLLGLRLDPGVATLAAASRHEATRPDIAAHAQPLPGGGDVLLGSTDPGEVAANLTTLGRRLLDAARAGGYDAIVDAGRLFPNSPAMPLVERSDVRLVCIVASVAAVEAVTARRAWLSDLLADRGGLLVIGESAYDDAQIAAAARTRVVGRLPWDRRAVASLAGGSGPSPTRSHLVRAARTLNDRLARPVVGATA